MEALERYTGVYAFGPREGDRIEVGINKGAAQLKRGVLKTLNPLALGKTIGAFARGHRQGLTQGDTWQQGGVLIVAADGAVKWHHASERPGDNAEPREIVAALKA